MDGKEMAVNGVCREFAQRIFGLSVGLGVCDFVPCPLKMARPLEVVENWHQITVGDVVHVIPFEADGRELFHHGMRFCCIPIPGVQTLMIRFRSIHSVDLVSKFLSMHGVITDASSLNDANDAEDES